MTNKSCNHLVTADELADRLRVTPETIKTWARQGRIPRIRLTSKVVRFNADSIIQQLTETGSDIDPAQMQAESHV